MIERAAAYISLMEQDGDFMITISLCMIVKNEEQVLERCLKSAAGVVDEIIIVDTGSSDETKKIAAKYTDKIYDFTWKDDFSAARNEAFSHAEMDYCMWLDADDIIPEQEQEKIKRLKTEMEEDTSIVMMRYVMGFDKAGRPSLSYYRERLIKNHRGYCWRGKVHEAVALTGKIVYTDIEIEHRKMKEDAGGRTRNLMIYRKMKEENVPFTARDLFYYGRELYYLAMDSPENLRESQEVLKKFLAHPDGWKENKIEACRFLALCCQVEGNEEGELTALLHSFFYDSPRAELCCDIGAWFFKREKYQTAAFWYEMALKMKTDEKSGGFTCPDCSSYIPALQLAICSYRMGDIEQAEQWNELALSFKPESESCRYNQIFFRGEREKDIANVCSIMI